jgi:apolipoprotein N-acyltransferase
VTRSDHITVLTAPVGLRSGGTLYTRIGDVFAWIAVVATLLLIGLRVARRHNTATAVTARGAAA